jgi:hypothetical protein
MITGWHLALLLNRDIALCTMTIAAHVSTRMTYEAGKLQICHRQNVNDQAVIELTANSNQAYSLWRFFQNQILHPASGNLLSIVSEPAALIYSSPPPTLNFIPPSPNGLEANMGPILFRHQVKRMRYSGLGLYPYREHYCPSFCFLGKWIQFLSHV